MEIWHNPKCSKSRAAREALAHAGREVRERRYLEDTPTAAEIENVLGKLGLEPWDITRIDDPLAKELKLRDAERDRKLWVETLATHPSLIQRPIVITDDGRAYVARDEQSIEQALS